MLSLASKSLFGVATTALVAAVGYAAVVGEEAGAAVLFFVAGAATIAGLALLTAGVRDTRADPAAAPGPPSTEPSRPSAWPFASALAAAMLAAGLAVGPALLGSGAVVLVLALFGWFAHAWTEHPSWDTSAGQRVVDRLLAPVVLPVAVVVLVAVIVISFSRVLLAVPKEAATAIALGAALAVLGACSYLAARPPLRSSVFVGLAAVAGLLTVTAGVGGAVAGEREFEHHESAEASAEHEPAEDGAADATDDATDATTDASTDTTNAATAAGPLPTSGESPTLTLKADKVAFDQKAISLPAGQTVSLVFENKEAVPHNVAIYSQQGAPEYRSEIITGPTTLRDLIPALAAGTYELRCDVHPQQMTGSVSVE